MSELTDTLKSAKALIEWGMSDSAIEAIDKALQHAGQGEAPLENDGDSRRLELECLSWLHNNYPAGSTYPAEIAWAVNEYSLWRWRNDPTEYRRAVVELAAAINGLLSAAKEDAS